MPDRSSLPDEAADFLRQHLGDSWTTAPLAGDASVRAYYRVSLSDGSTLMLAWYPAEVRPQLRRFLDAYEAVSPFCRVPEVLHHGEAASLQQDVGDRTLFDLLHEDRAEGVRLYRAAIDALVEFQRSHGRGINPPFTADFFYAELEMTREFYVEKLAGSASAGLETLFRKIADDLSRHPYVLCHRDYHGQNIHVVNDELFLIDYQDLRMGPDTYDLASLLRDRGVCRILGEETEEELVEYYRARTGADEGLRHRYFATLLQRSIKILGTFSKQPLVRGRLHYLDFIPPSLESVRRALRELPEYAELERLLPMTFDVDAARERLKEVSS